MSFLIALIVLFTCVLGEQTAGRDEAEQEILSIAEEMAQKLGGLCTGNYVQLMTNEAEITQYVHSWGNGLLAAGAPRRSTVIFLDEDLLSGLNAMMCTFVPGMEAYPDLLVRTMVSGLLSSLNARQGVSVIAASAIARYSEIRLLDDMEPGLGIAVLDYGEALPQVVVTLWIVEGGAAEISAAFVYADAIGGLLQSFSLDSTVEELMTFLQEHPELEKELNEIIGKLASVFGQ